MSYCDLHMHSTASDGEDAPQRLPALAGEAGLAAIALTDHDTTAGLARCAAACKKQGIDFLTGVEFSCEPVQGHGTCHLLGYGFDPEHPALADLLERQRESRQQRIPRIIAKLNELGVDVTYEEIREAVAAQAVGRPHVAAVLLQKGYVKTIKDAFDRYLGLRAPAYVPKPKVRVGAAIAALHAAGGLAVLAHPVQMRLPDETALAQVLAQLREAGLDGLECHHTDHAAAQVELYRTLAQRFELLITGGSDYHGRHKDIALGSQNVPLELFQILRDRLDG